MSSISERGVSQSERFTRRQLLKRGVGAGAIVLALTGGCAGEDPDRTERGLQIDDDAAKFIFGWYVTLIGSLAIPFILFNRRKKHNQPPPPPQGPNET